MASRFMTAAGESYRAFGMRKDARPLDYSLVSWNEAVPAVAILLLAQAVMLAGSFGNMLMDYLPTVFDIGFVTLVAFAVPFAVVIGWAVLAKQPERVPLEVLAPNLFGNALLGALCFMLYRGARGVAGLGIGSALSFAVLSAVALVLVTIGVYMLATGGAGIG